MREFKPKIFYCKRMNNMSDDANQSRYKIFISHLLYLYHYPLRRGEKEREMIKNSRAVDEKGKSWNMWQTIYFGGRNSIVLLEGSQASLPRTSDNSKVKVVRSCLRQGARNFDSMFQRQIAWHYFGKIILWSSQEGFLFLGVLLYDGFNMYIIQLRMLE